ncbi:MAG: hypothetical protein DRQ88_01325 [Epsilonproteobacteria bacterium]|nr:MAG: hypothetical protein DRQ89_05395 [Campylobacterota bacterium]RLA67934.1 MAG: hypothetical protein DRQ88_01325 [Campylobacterota bacterium]
MTKKEPDWKARAQELIQVAQDELKKTAEIGKKMLFASQKTTELRDYYEMLGHKAVTELKSKKLVWADPEVTEIMEQIQEMERGLQEIEEDVRKIKSGSAKKV